MKQLTLNRFGIATLLVMLFTAYVTSLKAQAVKTPFEEWNVTTGTQNFFYKAKTVTDGSGNVYVCGATMNTSGNYDILVAKYNSSGVQQWMNQYAGAGGGDDGAQAMIVDGSGNVYITGTYYANSTDSNNCITIKYNSSGVQQWLATYNGAGSRHDAGGVILMGNVGTYVFVGGSTWNSSTRKYDYLIIKYDVTTGAQQWATAWDYTNLNDAGFKLSQAPLFSGGALSLAGAVQTSTTHFQYCVAQFNLNTGAYITSSITGGSGPIGFDEVTGLVSDASGNIYVTGQAMNSNYDYYTVKFDANLNILWTATYNGSSNLDDEANDIQVDGSGNVYVTGYSKTSTQAKNIVTIKYNSSGTQQWAVSYDGRAHGEDVGTALAINSSNEVYLTGWSNNGENHDYITMKLNTSTGAVLWEKPFNYYPNGDDKANDMVIDANNDIIVTGQGPAVSGANTFVTVKYSEKSVITPPDSLSSSYAYIENRGQLLGTNSAATSIKYYNDKSVPMTYFTGSSLSYVLSTVDSVSTDIDSLTRVDMTLTGSVGSTIYPMSLRNDYYSYFKPHLTNGLGRVPLYNRLLRPGAYSNVDVMYASNSKGMVIYYIIKPTGKATDIQMTFSGASSVSINGSGDLVLATALGNISYKKATAYEINSSGSRVNLAWQPTFTIPTTNNVKFASIGTYNTSNTLVLELNFGPNTASAAITGLVWATYYGGGNDDDFTDVKALYDGSAVAGGMTISNNYPITTGVVQSTSAGGQDVAVAKFDSVGVRLWATYYGGSNNEFAEALIADSTGANIVVTGTTASNDFPLLDENPSSTAGPYFNSTFGGLRDIYLFKLNPAGTARFWSTYYGSTGGDRGNEIVKDKLGNYYVLGISTGNFPTQAETGAYNNSTLSGQTGAILKFTAGDSLIWATRFPAQLIQGGVAMNNGVLFITGNTANASPLPIFNLYPGISYVDSTFNGGGWDAFVTAFNINDTIRWSTYLGSSGLDDSYAMTKDANNNVFVVGQAGGANFPHKWNGSSNTYIDSTYGGNSDIFIAKFNTQLSMTWGTLFGGNQMEFATDVCADANNIYVTGFTQSPASSWSNLTVTGAYNDTHQNMQDAFIMSFTQPTNKRAWTSYYSGTAEDYAFGVDADKNRNHLFMVGWTKSPSGTTSWNFPTTQNQYTTAYYVGTLNNGTNNTAYQDGFIAEFNTQQIIAVGVEEFSPNFSFDVNIYPNPTQANVTVGFNLKEKQKVKISVYNLLGERVIDQDLGQQEGEFHWIAELSSLANGLYIIQVSVGKETVSKKVIKQY